MKSKLIEKAKQEYILQQAYDSSEVIVNTFGEENLQYFEFVSGNLIRIVGTDIILRYNNDEKCFFYDMWSHPTRITSYEIRSLVDLGKCLIIDGK